MELLPIDSIYYLLNFVVCNFLFRDVIEYFRKNVIVAQLNSNNNHPN